MRGEGLSPGLWLKGRVRTGAERRGAGMPVGGRVWCGPDCSWQNWLAMMRVAEVVLISGSWPVVGTPEGR